MIAWHEAHMERRLCAHCQQPLLTLKCDGCAGLGYYWARDEVGDTPIDCYECGGSGHVSPCTNTDCPGKTWYSLSRADSATLRMVIQRIEREEAK